MYFKKKNKDVVYSNFLEDLKKEYEEDYKELQKFVEDPTEEMYKNNTEYYLDILRIATFIKKEK